MKKADRERNLALVEQAIHEHGWSLTLERALAQKLGVTTRAIRYYRQDVEDLTRQEIAKDRRLVRASLLLRLRGHQLAARKANKFGPLASMVGLEARICGLMEPEGPESVENLEALSREDLLRELAADLSAEDLSALSRLREEG